MQAGKLRKRISIQAPTPVVNDHNENVPTWTTTTKVWASINPLRGQLKALAQANTLTATATHEIRMRFGPDVRVGFHRVLYGATFAEPLVYQTLTTERYLALDANDYRAMTTTPSTIGKVFTINSILDTDTDHDEIVILATENPA